VEMIRAGTVTAPDMLPFDSGHKAIWAALAAGDRPLLAQALAAFAAGSTTPLVHAVAAAALVELGQADLAARVLRHRLATGGLAAPVTAAINGISAALAAGRDPFTALDGQAELGGTERIALLGMVHSILRSTAPAGTARELEQLLARIRPGVNALPPPGYAAAVVITGLFFPPRYLNLGGGGRFMHPFWANADLVAPPGAGPRLRFSTATILPFDDASLDLAYSSHCLEHLDDATVSRLLAEMRRVLRPDGRLVLKLPDAEDAIRQWQAGNKAYFGDASWGLDSVTWTWAAHGVRDDLDSRFAMLFCGYWNEAMSRPGSPQELLAAGAFHGPPRIEPDRLRALVATGSPHHLAQGLRARALELAPEARFNHQNAWSRQELAALLDRCGYQVVSQDAQQVIDRCTMVPDILNYRSISLYAEARPATAERSAAPPAVLPEEQVTPAAAAGPNVRISARNARAWYPESLPNVEPRALRPGLVQLHRVLWEYHMDMVRRLRESHAPSHFLSYGYARGQVPADPLASMARIFDSPPFLFELDDYRADGFHSEMTPPEVEDLRRNLRYYSPDPGQRAAIEGFLTGIGAQVEAELQTPWKVLNVRCYDTAISFRTGPQMWHTDGFPSAIVKLLVYLTTDGTPVNGSELVDLQGQRVAVSGGSGTWLLFDPNRLVHRGPVEGQGPRRIIEITLCPALSNDIAYRFGGTNYRHPLCPPTIDLFQQGLLLQVQPLARTVFQAAQQLCELERKAGTG